MRLHLRRHCSPRQVWVRPVLMEVSPRAPILLVTAQVSHSPRGSCDSPRGSAEKLDQTLILLVGQHNDRDPVLKVYAEVYRLGEFRSVACGVLAFELNACLCGFAMTGRSRPPGGWNWAPRSGIVGASQPQLDDLDRQAQELDEDADDDEHHAVLLTCDGRWRASRSCSIAVTRLVEYLREVATIYASQNALYGL
jgi:hypothetical protein